MRKRFDIPCSRRICIIEEQGVKALESTQSLIALEFNILVPEPESINNFQTLSTINVRMSDDKTLTKIPHFDGHYDHWSELMENLLRAEGLWDIVERGFVEPLDGALLNDN
ncbi:hypothetical protein LIER_37985 [Lithospermum erythrorhizon]|uniref:Uncharacterized protein n=1 Tax=Lithospermum erythrorhizon TaxID=34254 RepID=A0AAV3PT07_LITER